MLSKSNKKWLKIAPRPSQGTQQRKSRRVELLARKGLLPPSIKDDELAAIHFQREFRSRFGSRCPQFFTGSLQNAVNQACGRGIDDEKLLAIYLHNDSSLNSDRYCIQLLCSDLTLDILQKRFVTWAWDVTDESNKQRFLVKAASYFDRSTLYDVTRANKDRYPMVLILRCRNNRCRVQKRLEGYTSPEDIVAILSEQVFYAEQERRVCKENDKQRAIRKSILDQQQMEYEQSLKADQEKARKQEEEAKLKKMNKVNANKLRELEIKENRKMKAEANRMKASLRKEPGSSRNIIHIRLRKPTGEGFLSRKFSKSDKLQDLLNFIVSEGFSLKYYRVISVCPRRELSNLNPKRPLNAYGLTRKETLIIEQK